jgi:hypothetical protein
VGAENRSGFDCEARADRSADGCRAEKKGANRCYGHALDVGAIEVEHFLSPLNPVCFPAPNFGRYAICIPSCVPNAENGGKLLFSTSGFKASGFLWR